MNFFSSCTYAQDLTEQLEFSGNASKFLKLSPNQPVQKPSPPHPGSPRPHSISLQGVKGRASLVVLAAGTSWTQCGGPSFQKNMNLQIQSPDTTCIESGGLTTSYDSSILCARLEVMHIETHSERVLCSLPTQNLLWHSADSWHCQHGGALMFELYSHPGNPTSDHIPQTRGTRTIPHAS